MRLDVLDSREAFLLEYGRKSAEASRQSKEELYTIQNSRKARVGALAGLRDVPFMARKMRDEADLISKLLATGGGSTSAAAVWDKIALAKKVASRIAKPYFYYERGYAFDSELFAIARTLVRLAQEKPKPNADRLKEYRDSALKSLELELFSEAPIHADFEQARLGESLAHWKLRMPDDPLVRDVLRGAVGGGNGPPDCDRIETRRCEHAAPPGRGGARRHREIRRPDDQAGHHRGPCVAGGSEECTKIRWKGSRTPRTPRSQRSTSI